MGNALKGRPEHSAEYFGDTRDHWWHDDYLRLIAGRWGVDAVREVLDVGCGVGHWGRILRRALPEGVQITGVDREPGWIEEATRRAEQLGLSGSMRYRQAVGEALPFPDDSFDLVTCQTVLMHVPDPAAVLREMLRVTRPGGLVVASEPVNRIGPLVHDALQRDQPIEAQLARVELQLRCERGKLALGQGDLSLGDHVPPMFVQCGLTDVQVYLNNRPGALLPPYASVMEQLMIEEQAEAVERQFSHWGHDQTRAYFLAGGGRPEAFEGLWAATLAHEAAVLEGLRAGTYARAGGYLGYLTSGRKPRTAPLNPAGGTSS